MKRKSVFNSFILMNFGIIIVFMMLLMSCSSDDSNPTAPQSSIPELTTQVVSAIALSTAASGGGITSDGGAAITARGVCWSTSQEPTISNNKSEDGNGAGDFTSALSGLVAETKYYVRAYATNSAGTGYGSETPFTTLGTVTDIDGNMYHTVKLGNQWWTKENLNVTHYRNGESIPEIADDTGWTNLTTGAYCNYDNNSSNAATYGRLYNWYAVDDSRGIAPAGWHVATDAEWQELEKFLGMSQNDASGSDWRGTDEGGKLKESGTSHWGSPNLGATDASGFSALPGGYRVGYGNNGGNYYKMGDEATYWTASSGAWFRNLSYLFSEVLRGDPPKGMGHSARCIKD